MAVKVVIPIPLQKFARNQTSCECEASTVAELFEVLETTFPDIKGRLRDSAGEPLKFLNFYVNSEDIRFLDGVATRLESGSEVMIEPAVAGS